MKIWTVIPFSEYELFQQTGILQCDDTNPNVLANDMDEYYTCYEWMSTQLRKKVNSLLKYPRWVWYQVEGSTDPDFVDKCFYRVDNGKFALLIFDIPEETVLLSDYDNWHVCLNGGHLDYTEEDSEYWDLLLEDYSDFLHKWGIDVDFNHITNPQYYDSLSVEEKNWAEVIRQEIFKSWELVFDLVTVNNWFSNWTNRTIQGVTWTLNKKNLIEVRIFDITPEDRKCEESYE